MTDYLIVVFLVTTLLWLLWRAENKWYMKRIGYRQWYAVRYLQMPSWKMTRKIKLWLSGYRCAKCGKTTTLQVHHRTWAYRWKYWEWLPWVLLFGLQVLCAYHHEREKR